MSLYSRLDRRLEAQADNAGPVRGTLSVTPHRHDLARRQPRRHHVADGHTADSRRRLLDRADDDRARNTLRRSGAHARRQHRHPNRPTDDGADPWRVRHPRQPAAGDGERRHPDGLELGAGHVGRGDRRLPRREHDRILEPGVVLRALSDDRRADRDPGARGNRQGRTVARRADAGDHRVDIHRRLHHVRPGGIPGDPGRCVASD